MCTTGDGLRETAGGLRETGILRGFQGHRCVPLDEIYLTVPLSPRNGSSGRFDLTEETTHFASKSWIFAFQRHRCVPLDEIYLTVPLSPWNGSSGRFDLTEETTHFACKSWICASGFWDSEFARRLRGLQGHGYVPLDEIYFTMPLIRFR